MTGGEDEPEPDGSRGADRGPRASRQGRQPSGLAGRQPRLGRADTPAAGPAPAAGGRGALGPAWCLHEITRVAFAEVDQGGCAYAGRTLAIPAAWGAFTET